MRDVLHESLVLVSPDVPDTGRHVYSATRKPPPTSLTWQC